MIAPRKFFGQVVHVETPGTPIVSVAGYWLGLVKEGKHFIADSGVWTTAEGYAEMTRAYDVDAQYIWLGGLTCG